MRPKKEEDIIIKLNFQMLGKCWQSWQICAPVCWNVTKVANFYFLAKNWQNVEFSAVQTCVHVVELDKRCKTNTCLQKSAAIQPRTSPPKSGNIWQQLGTSVKVWQSLARKTDRRSREATDDLE